MFDFEIEKHEKYKLEYSKFIESNIKSKAKSIHLNYADGVAYDSVLLSLLKYNASNTNNNGQEIFFIVPSIFNSPEILFLNRRENLIENLQKKGNVYVVNWLENNKQLSMEDYVYETIKAINVIADRPVHLIGHCIGGNISIAALVLLNNSSLIKSLSLLTTPWDYSHFNQFVYINKLLNIENAIEGFDFVPVIYMQMMFFLMFPMQFNNKVNKYFDLTSEEAKNLFMQVEKWLGSGNKISKSIYNQIMHDFCVENILFKNKWYIDDILIDPKNINIPVCIIFAKDDQIAPFKSMNSLQKQIKNSTIIEVEGGHIGYLLNNKSDFHRKYSAWINDQCPSMNIF